MSGVANINYLCLWNADDIVIESSSMASCVVGLCIGCGKITEKTDRRNLLDTPCQHVLFLWKHMLKLQLDKGTDQFDLEGMISDAHLLQNELSICVGVASMLTITLLKHKRLVTLCVIVLSHVYIKKIKTNRDIIGTS